MAMIKAFFVILVAATLLFPVIGAAQELSNSLSDSAITDTSGCVISIERITVDNMQLHDTLNVVMATEDLPIGGFDLKIGIDNIIVDIVEVLPGTLIDSCHWEYFHARQIEQIPSAINPFLVWQIVALAQMTPDTARSVCFGLGQQYSLFRLVLSSEHVREIPDTTVPVFFFWEDCTDNTLSSRSGNTLLISRHIFDYFGAIEDTVTKAFPSRTGTPQECLRPGKVNQPRRLADFHNGGVEFRLDIGLEPEDSTNSGD